MQVLNFLETVDRRNYISLMSQFHPCEGNYDQEYPELNRTLLHEEYERVGKRYEFLIEQKNDLFKAENTLMDIIKEMDNIISQDLDITRKQISLDEAEEYYSSLGYQDKIETLKYRHQNVNIYKCDGYKNYMYGYMVPSTGYLKEFEVHYLNPGFLVQY
ncbi:MAG: hypothetical protein EOM17_13910, partial [Synergistales bacterium]|nr:hypothetical protein [Synergistales bacterium]